MQKPARLLSRDYFRFQWQSESFNCLMQWMSRGVGEGWGKFLVGSAVYRKLCVAKIFEKCSEDSDGNFEFFVL